MTRVETAQTPSGSDQSARQWRLPRIRFRAVVFFVIVLSALYGLGRIGFINLPLMATAEPRREVASSGSSSVVTHFINPATENSSERGAYITEAEVTAWLRQQGMPLQAPQVTIEPTDIEIFGYLSARPTMAVTALLQPEVTDSKTKLVVKRLRLGTLSLPSWMSGVFLGPIATTLVPQLLSVPHTSVDLAFGKLLISSAVTQ